MAMTGLIAVDTSVMGRSLDIGFSAISLGGIDGAIDCARRAQLLRQGTPEFNQDALALVGSVTRVDEEWEVGKRRSGDSAEREMKVFAGCVLLWRG